MLNIEQSIINQIVTSDEFFTKTHSIIKSEYFKDEKTEKIFTKIKSIIEKYDRKPNLQDLSNYIELEKNIDNKVYKDLVDEIGIIFDNKVIIDDEIFIPTVLKFCKERAYRNSLLKGMESLKAGKNLYLPMEEMEKALSIEIDNDIGFDLFDRVSARERFAKNRDVNTIKSGFKPWDDITGGLENGTLNIIQAPTNGGKTLVMGYLAAKYAVQGYNVLYVTCEMADHKIALRQEASLCDTELDMFRKTITDVEDYLKLFDAMCDDNPNRGKMWIKEYPTGEANHLTIKNLVKQLKSKKNLKFDIIVVDYLMILNTTKKINFDNTFAWQMAVAIELRGLAMTLKIPFLSGMQLTRDAMKSIKKQQDKANIGLEDMAGSIGVAQTIDTLITQYPLDKEKTTHYLNDTIKEVYRWTNSKTRNTDNKETPFYVGVNGAKMSLYEIDTPESRHTQVNQAAISKMDETINDWVKDNDWAKDFADV